MKKEVVLKSFNPREYPDEIVICKIIQNNEINSYLATIPEDKKIIATKIASVKARLGIVGEEIHTTLLTERNGRIYILSEENNIIRERTMPNGSVQPDVVITNINSTSNEQYIVKANKFSNMYTANNDGSFAPNPEERVLTQIQEDLIIMTSWGSEAVCLKGSYIVTYNAAENDFNTIEQGAFDSTYSIISSAKKL